MLIAIAYDVTDPDSSLTRKRRRFSGCAMCYNFSGSSAGPGTFGEVWGLRCNCWEWMALSDWYTSLSDLK